MQVLVSATSSKVDELILIETTTTIGEQASTARTAYNTEELMDNRFLSGDLETRIEALRIGAESITVRAVEAHFKTLMKVLQKEPEVTEVKGLTADVVILDEVPEEPVKKPRAKRSTSPSNLPK